MRIISIPAYAFFDEHLKQLIEVLEALILENHRDDEYGKAERAGLLALHGELVNRGARHTWRKL